MGLDLSRESPGDVAVTLRSLPRRFGEAVAPDEDETEADIDALVRVVGPDGASALDHVADTGRTLALLGGAILEVTSGHEPVLHAAVTDPAARQWELAATDLEGELSLLADEALALAERIERTPATQWAATGRVVGGTTRSALELAHEAVRTAITGLRATEAAMAAARRA